MNDLKEALRHALDGADPRRQYPVRATEDAQLRAHFESLSESEKAREYFYDSNTWLPNERAWNVMRAGGSPGLHANYSIEGVGYVNDVFGHDAGQLVYRAAAESLAEVDPHVAKVQADFGGFVGSEDEALRRARIATRKLPPEFHGLQITAAVGPTWEAACEAHAAKKQGLVAAGLRAKRKLRPHGLDPGWTPKCPARWGVATPSNPVPGRVASPLREDLFAAYRSLPPDVAFEQTYRDPLTTTLGHTGMGIAEQPGDHILSIDIDGLRVTDEFESALGDQVLRRVGEVMAQLQEEQGESLAVAHPHGDEFQAAHPHGRLLRRFAEAVREVLAHEKVTFTDPLTKKTYVQDGIGMSFGIGRMRDLAEAELKRNKAERITSLERDRKGQSIIAQRRLQVRAATPAELQAARSYHRPNSPRPGRFAAHAGAQQVRRSEDARPGRPPVPMLKRPVAATTQGADGRCATLQSRGLRPETLRVFAGTWHEGADGQIIFPRKSWTRAPDGSCRVAATGLDLYGPATWSSTDVQRRGVWDSGEHPGTRRLVVVERPIDAMSHYQLHSEPGTRYFATGQEGITAEQQTLIADAARSRRIVVVAAFAGSLLGSQLAGQVEAALPRGARFERETPPRGSWNDHLQRFERDFIRGQGVRERARGLVRSPSLKVRP